jgi:hypothetical protein
VPAYPGRNAKGGPVQRTLATPANALGKSFTQILSEELTEIRALRQSRHQATVGLNPPSPADRTAARQTDEVIPEAESALKKAAKEPALLHERKINGRTADEIPSSMEAAANAELEIKQLLEQQKSDGIIADAHASLLTGLAFSGGGIRSATFNLGVLQALADLDLLKTFDYLSTVSGGGYIGSWLATWIYRCGLSDVTHELGTSRVQDPGHQEAEELRFLREYSNYLTPKLGFLSLDTWNMVATYLRNTLLNLSILILAMAALLLLPHAGVALTTLLTDNGWLLECAGALIVVIILFVGVNMAPNVFERPPKKRFACLTQPIAAQLAGAAILPAGWLLSIWLTRPHSVCATWNSWTWLVLGASTYLAMWVLASVLALLARLAGKGYDKISRDTRDRLHSVCPWITVFGVLAFLVISGWLIHALHPWLVQHITVKELQWPTTILAVVLTVVVTGLAILNRYTATSSGISELIATLFSAILAGALGGLLLKGTVSLIHLLAARSWGSLHVMVLATPVMVTALLVVAAIQVGLMGLLLNNPKREWWSRFGGWVLILCMSWIVVVGISLYSGPFPEAYDTKIWGYFVKWGLTPAWILSTLTGVLAGKSRKTGDDNSLLDRLVSFTPYVFVVGLLAAVSYALSAIFTRLETSGWAPMDLGVLFLHPGPLFSSPCMGPWKQVGGSAAWLTIPCLWILAASLLLFAAAWGLSARVDINEFSMHLFYRNRLVKCYLGASNVRQRWAHPFTGFDPNDDVLLSKLRTHPRNPREPRYSGPFPIINTTLNLVQGGYLAWQERKAESFVFTPLNCGYDVWVERLRMRDQKYGYRPTDEYGFPDGGFYLGGAMSISGAAASPNMGYHSSAAMAFLMTVFDVRLGWWAGNPRKEKWQQATPAVGLAYLINELSGHTNDNSNYVYLSDGGHFENLGIYELVKRRCAFIVACDAGADPDCGFGDLGAAIRKCREDMGVEITIKTDGIFPSTEGPGTRSQYHYAVGEIDYRKADLPLPAGGVPNGVGIFVYIKASLTGDEPADVLNYKTEHPIFPHESTANQWFTESQFESYRTLGHHIANTVFEMSWSKNQSQFTPEQIRLFPADSGIRTLFEHLRGYPDDPKMS